MTSSKPPVSEDLWLSGLKGQVLDSEQDESAEHREGRLLRQLFLERLRSRQDDGAMPQSPSAEIEEIHWRTILEKAQQDGLFVQVPQPKAAVWWRRLSGIGTTTTSDAEQVPLPNRVAANQRYYAIAAGIAVLAVGVGMVMQTMKFTPPENGGEIIFRGDEMTQHLLAKGGDSPSVLAGGIEDILRQHGLNYQRVTTDNGSIQIQAKVPKDSIARRELEKLGVVVPAHGRLNLLVEHP